LKDPIAALPLQIFTYPSPRMTIGTARPGGALVLILIIFVINVGVRALTRKDSQERPMSVTVATAQPKREGNPLMTETNQSLPLAHLASPARTDPPCAHPFRVALEVDNLCCWFGLNQAVYELNLQSPPRRYRIIRPERLRESTFLRCLNRMHDCRGSRLSGKSGCLEKMSTGASRRHPGACRRRHGLQKSNPFPR